MEKDKRSMEERKAHLLQQGELHRQGIVLARQHIQHGIKPEVMIHNAIDHATWSLRSKVDSLLTPTGLSVTAVAPYALKVLGIIRRRRMTKPALGVAALVGVAAWYVNHRRSQPA